MSDQPSAAARAYWRANLRLAGILLGVWALVSFGFGIVLRPVLDAISIGGAPLGFWFAQQGAIYVFVVLIFIYSWRMTVLERRYAHVAEAGGDPDPAPESGAAAGSEAG